MPSRSRLTSFRVEGGEHVDDRGLLDRVEAPDGAEVDQAEGAVGEGEDVARMRVGVEEAGPQHLVERRVQQQLGEGLSVDAPVVELRAVGQRCSPRTAPARGAGG